MSAKEADSDTDFDFIPADDAPSGEKETDFPAADDVPSTIPPPPLPPETVILTEEEKAAWVTDSGRGEIRQRISSEFTTNQTVSITDNAGNVLDQLSGSLPADPLAEPTYEEMMSRANAASKRQADEDWLETVIRPSVMTKLRDEARAEFINKLQAQHDEIMSLQHKLAIIRRVNTCPECQAIPVESLEEPSTAESEATARGGSP